MFPFINTINSYLLLQSLYYAEACNKLVGPTSLRDIA